MGDILDLKTIYEYLRDNGYVMVDKNELVFTRKFMEEIEPFRQRKRPVRMVEALPVPIKQDITTVTLFKPIDWRLAYADFIRDAHVPSKLEGKGTDLYDGNKYTEDAMKEFKRMIEKEGIDLAILIKSTMLYYAPGKKYRKKISNYITEGIWRSDYDALILAAKTGEKELKTHIEKEIKDGQTHQPWSF